MSVANKAEIVAILGSSGSGKSTTIKQWLKKKKPKRLIIVDPMGEYGDYATHIATLEDCVTEASKKSFKIAFKTSSLNPVEQFEVLCKLAYAVGDCVLIVDELAIYTKPLNAPPSWRDCSMRGRHRGLVVIGASQRPASIDKDFFGNATTIRTGRLNYKPDIVTMSNVLHVPANEISTLKPLEWIQRDMSTGEISKGTVII